MADVGNADIERVTEDVVDISDRDWINIAQDEFRIRATMLVMHHVLRYNGKDGHLYLMGQKVPPQLFASDVVEWVNKVLGGVRGETVEYPFPKSPGDVDGPASTLHPDSAMGEPNSFDPPELVLMRVPNQISIAIPLIRNHLNHQFDCHNGDYLASGWVNLYFRGHLVPRDLLSDAWDGVEDWCETTCGLNYSVQELEFYNFHTKLDLKSRVKLRKEAAVEKREAGVKVISEFLGSGDGAYTNLTFTYQSAGHVNDAKDAIRLVASDPIPATDRIRSLEDVCTSANNAIKSLIESESEVSNDSDQ